jgi:hypothetical protein
MVSCSTVAKATHNKYGIFINDTHRAYGNITIRAQINVPRISKISIDAR